MHNIIISGELAITQNTSSKTSPYIYYKIRARSSKTKHNYYYSSSSSSSSSINVRNVWTSRAGEGDLVLFRVALTACQFRPRHPGETEDGSRRDAAGSCFPTVVIRPADVSAAVYFRAARVWATFSPALFFFFMIIIIIIHLVFTSTTDWKPIKTTICNIYNTLRQTHVLYYNIVLPTVTSRPYKL